MLLNSNRIKNEARPVVVLLAAGLSDRMGKPKHGLMFNEDQIFLEHIISVYQKYSVSSIILVVNEFFEATDFDFDNSVKTVINYNPEFGRFHSIQLGLKETKNSSVFIQNVDNPFVNPGLLMGLKDNLNDFDFVVPVFEGRGGHPIFLSQQTVESIIKDYKKDSRFNEVLESFNRKNILVNDPYVTVNINTLDDYQKYFSGF